MKILKYITTSLRSITSGVLDFCKPSRVVRRAEEADRVARTYIPLGMTAGGYPAPESIREIPELLPCRCGQSVCVQTETHNHGSQWAAVIRCTSKTAHKAPEMHGRPVIIITGFESDAAKHNKKADAAEQWNTVARMGLTAQRAA